MGLIVYNGAMVDVGSLLQKLEKSERVRAEIEQKLQLLEEKTGGILLWQDTETFRSNLQSKFYSS